MEAPTPPGAVSPGERAAMRDRLVSVAAVAFLAAASAGGAALHPSGVSIGLPSTGGWALAAFAGALIWTLKCRGLGGFLLPLAGLALAAFVPGAAPLLLFSGRPLAIFVLAALVMALSSGRFRLPRAALLPAFFAIYASVAYQAQARVGPDGDEPQYLMVAESLVTDQDLVLDEDFRLERYRAFYSRPLEPHFRIRGPEGQIYSLHAVGLSVLILPAYALFGYPGASFFMALVAALLIREIRRLVAALSGDDGLADASAWVVGLSPPIIHFAGLIFTEVPAALLLCVGLRTAALGANTRSALIAAVCAGALPWLNVRYAILSAAIVLALAWRIWESGRASSPIDRARGAVAPAIVLVASALALCLYHFALWGFFDPRRIYGRRREFSLDILPEGLPGLFFDQEFGLFVYAPIFVLALPGWFRLWRRHRGLAAAALLASCGVIATASVWPMWRGGFNPPARFLLPLVPVLAASMALMSQTRLRPTVALLAGFGLWTGIFGAMNIETVHRDRDGVAPFFRAQSGAREWTNALPSFVLSEDRPTRALAIPWAGLLVLAFAVASRPFDQGEKVPRHRDSLLPTAAFMAVAVLCDAWSPRERSPERDAVRLLGRPSILVPSLQFEPITEAIWPVKLFFEPHRSPAGFAFARALALAPGRYSVSLGTADAIDAEAGAVTMLMVRDRRTGESQRGPMAMTGVSGAGGGGDEPHPLMGTFDVAQHGVFDLALLGGSPRSFQTARLAPILR
jgi:hypothetical protein